MNDRFKFRAWSWDKESGKYEPVYWLGNYDDLYADSIDKIFLAKGIVFNQCTGRRDKNGKSIYEGDIIKGCMPYNRDMIYAVEWGEILDSEYGDPTYGFGFEERPEESVVVIGNIYENPELIINDAKASIPVDIDPGIYRRPNE